MITNALTTFAADKCHAGFLHLPTWYQYLKLDNQCQVADFQVPGDFLLVMLAIIDILLNVAGLVAVGFVIYGGIRYATSQGNPDEAANAQSTVINALVGLMLAVIAVAMISFLGSHVGGH